MNDMSMNNEQKNALDTICTACIKAYNKTATPKVSECPYDKCRYAMLRKDLNLEFKPMDDLHNEPADHNPIRVNGALGGVMGGLD